MSQVPRSSGWSANLRCTTCQHRLEKPAETCPACGADLTAELSVSYRPRPGRVGRLVAWTALAVIALCVVGTAILTVWKLVLAGPSGSD